VRAASQASKAADWLLGFVPVDGAAVSAETVIDRRAA
jgi:antirestriction protein ArdC